MGIGATGVPELLGVMCFMITTSSIPVFRKEGTVNRGSTRPGRLNIMLKLPEGGSCWSFGLYLLLECLLINSLS